MANPRLQRLKANIKADLEEICKRAAPPEPIEEPQMESLWKPELRPYVNMKAGQLGPNIQGYCPIHMLSKLPIKFLADKLLADVDEKFYQSGKFWQRPWILYVFLFSKFAPFRQRRDLRFVCVGIFEGIVITILVSSVLILVLLTALECR
jgi:hypothetical protein